MRFLSTPVPPPAIYLIPLFSLYLSFFLHKYLFFFKTFTSFGLHWVSVAPRDLSLAVVRWLLIAVASLVTKPDSSRCGSQVGCGVWDPSSWARDPVCVPCIGRRILNRGTMREVP